MEKFEKQADHLDVHTSVSCLQFTYFI